MNTQTFNPDKSAKVNGNKPICKLAIIAGALIFASCDSANDTSSGGKMNIVASPTKGENGIVGGTMSGDEVMLLYHKSNTTDADLMNEANFICGQETGGKAGTMRAAELAHSGGYPAGIDAKVFIKCIQK